MWVTIPLLIVGAYVALCALLYLGQRKMIYMPRRAAVELPNDFVEWRSPQGELWGYERQSGANACLFFFHGNGGNASGWSHAVAEFPGDIYVLEYPGYGLRPGSPSEASIKQAALTAFEAEAGRYTNVIVAGQSLGTGVTEAIFRKHPDMIDRLVLITPFTSIADVARTQFPWVPTSLILKDRYELFDAWRQFPGKTCILLAGRDEVIPASHGKRYLGAKGDVCEIIELPHDSHNSISLDQEFWTKLLR